MYIDHIRRREILPEILVFPKTTEEVSKLLKLCNQENVVVVPYGAGTGLEGGAMVTTV